MGVITTETPYDDLTGEPGDDVREFVFVLDGTRYRLDACLTTREQIRSALAPFIAVARSEVDGSEDDPALVREWARNHGFRVSHTGRIPLRVIEAYHRSVR